ncbi:MAG: protein translocase subunit SecD, partial [Deltaproteobacteria bacterium]|nr:protein translocase subunit SecD [Deltaproteobacteria bacterium]
MSKSLKARGLLVFICLGLALFSVAPSLIYDSLPQWWQKAVDPIHRGLDLQGGMHLVLGVDVDKAVESRVDSLADQLEGQLREQDIVFKRVERRQGDRLVVVVYDEDASLALDKLAAESFANLEGETLPATG